MNPPRLRFLDALVLLLSIYAILALLIDRLVPLEANVRELMDNLDLVVCAVFFIDFAIRFHRAESKMAFMKWGWIDLLSCIPAGLFSLGRAVRIVQIVRILRAFRSARAIMCYLHEQRARSMAGTTVLMAIVLLLFSMVSILVFENEPDSNIRSPMDALWWGITTMTTVGYGDHFPVTPEGRFVAMILMITGVGLFGVLTGLFARFFVEPEMKRDEVEMKELLKEVRQMNERLESIENRLSGTQTP